MPSLQVWGAPLHAHAVNVVCTMTSSCFWCARPVLQWTLKGANLGTRPIKLPVAASHWKPGVGRRPAQVEWPTAPFGNYDFVTTVVWPILSCSPLLPQAVASPSPDCRIGLEFFPQGPQNELCTKGMAWS